MNSLMMRTLKARAKLTKQRRRRKAVKNWPPLAGIFRYTIKAKDGTSQSMTTMVDRVPPTIDQLKEEVGKRLGREVEQVRNAGGPLQDDGMLQSYVKTHWKAGRAEELARVQANVERITSVLDRITLPKDVLDEMETAMHQLWEFSCRVELHAYLLSLVRIAARLLRTTEAIPLHISAAAFLARMSRTAHYSVHIKSARVLSALAGAMSMAAGRRAVDLAQVVVNCIAQLAGHRGGLSILASERATTLLAATLDTALTQGNAFLLRNALATLCYLLQMLVEPCTDSLVESDIMNIFSRIIKKRGVSNGDLFLVAACSSRFLPHTRARRRLLRSGRSAITLNALWKVLQQRLKRARVLPLHERNMLWSGVMHSSVTMWGCIAELNASSRTAATAFHSTREGDEEEEKDTLTPEMLCSYLVEMLDTHLEATRQSGVGMMFSMPTTPALGKVLLKGGVVERLVKIVREPRASDYLQMSGVGAVGVLAAMDYPQLTDCLWENNAAAVISTVLSRHLAVCYDAEGKLKEPRLLARQCVVLQLAAASYLWLVKDCTRHQKAVMMDLVLLLGFPEIHVIRFTALALWCVCHNKEARATVDRHGAGVYMLRCMEIFVMSFETPEERPTSAALRRGAVDPFSISTLRTVSMDELREAAEESVSSSTTSRKLHRQLSKRKASLGSEAPSTHSGVEGTTQAESRAHDPVFEGAVLGNCYENRDLMLQAFLAVAGSMWLLLTEESQIVRFVRRGGVQVLDRIIRRREPTLSQVQIICVKIIWHLSQFPSVRASLVPVKIVDHCLDLAGTPSIARELRTLAAGFVLELSKDPAFRGVLVQNNGADFQEELLVGFLNSPYQPHHQDGASSIARTVDTPKAKTAVARLGGTKRLVSLLKQYRQIPGSDMTVLAMLHAILNLTTLETNQRIVGECGASFLSALAVDDDAKPEFRGFAARILKNLSRFAGNRTRLYRAELKLKSDRWHKEACNETNPDVVEAMKESIAQAGLWSKRFELPGSPLGRGPPRRLHRPKSAGTGVHLKSGPRHLSRSGSARSGFKSSSRRRPPVPSSSAAVSKVFSLRRRGNPSTRPNSAAPSFRSGSPAGDSLPDVSTLLAGAANAALAGSPTGGGSGGGTGYNTPSSFSSSATVALAVSRMRRAAQARQEVEKKDKERAAHKPPAAVAQLHNDFMAWFDELVPSKEAPYSRSAPSTPRRRGSRRSRPGSASATSIVHRPRTRRGSGVGGGLAGGGNRTGGRPREPSPTRRRAADAFSPVSGAGAGAGAGAGSRPTSRGRSPSPPSPSSRASPFRRSPSPPPGLSRAPSGYGFSVTPHGATGPDHNALLAGMAVNPPNDSAYNTPGLGFELPSPDPFGMFDDGAWSEGGHDVHMSGLRSQGPFKRLETAPVLQRAMCTPLRDFVLRDIDESRPNPAVQESRDVVLESAYRLHSTKISPRKGGFDNTGMVGDKSSVLRDSQDLVDLLEEGSQRVEVRVTETVPFRWKPTIASYHLDKASKRQVRSGVQPTTVVLAARTKRHHVNFHSNSRMLRARAKEKEATRIKTKNLKKRRAREVGEAGTARGERYFAAVVAKRKPSEKREVGPEIPVPLPEPSVKMCKFVHVAGCTVCKDLYEHFTLPDGTQVHYYHDDQLRELVTETGMPPPTPPLALKDIFHDEFPRMPRLGPPPPHAIPKAHVPVLRPPVRPLSHKLAVKEHDHPEPGHRCPEYGFLPGEEPVSFVLRLVPVKVVVEEKKEEGKKARFDVRQAPSVFRYRISECASRDVYDLQRAENRAFRVDWNRVVEKERFKRFVAKTGGDEMELNRIKMVMKEHYGLLSDSFDYYAAKGLGPDAFSMQFGAFFDLLQDCSLIDKSLRRQDAEVVFKVANIEEDSHGKAGQANQDRALCRFELMEALIRMSNVKYIKPKICSTLSEAVSKLMAENVAPVLEPLQEWLDSNVFRKQQLYTGDVNAVFLKRYSVLRALHSYYCEFKHGAKQKRMSLKEWEKMLKDADMFDEDFTRQEAVFAFTFSKMVVHDELKQHLMWTTLTLTDFLEALARVADMTSMPTTEDLEAVGVENAFRYFEKLATTDVAYKHQRRDSSEQGMPRTRPLAVKIERLLELMFGRLDRTGDGELTAQDFKSWV